MIIRFNNRDFHLSWEVTFEEKINKLKKSNDITFAFNLPETELFDGSEISNINIEVLKGSGTNPLYKWVFYNCNLIQFHIAPSRWSNSKTIFLKVSYEDVIGSHLDGIITSKLRDKKLDDLLK
jgi:hypothetical protein